MLDNPSTYGTPFNNTTNIEAKHQRRRKSMNYTSKLNMAKLQAGSIIKKISKGKTLSNL